MREFLVGSLLAIACGIGLIAELGAQRPEPFLPGTSRIPSSPFRSDPHPKWVPVQWDPGEDAPYRKIRSEVDLAIAQWNGGAVPGPWPDKAREAFRRWMGDCQNPERLFRASASLGVARTLDPEFATSDECARMTAYLDEGWSILRQPPHSYEFVRQGYLSNAGDSDYHIYGDLPIRLLDRDPQDREVTLAMVREYRSRKPVEKFEQTLFRALDRVSKSTKWKPRDELTEALAYRLYGQKHKKPDAYAVALKKARSARAKVPPSDRAQIDRWIEATAREAKDPLFGLPRGAKWIDDFDPPGEE